MKQFIFKFSAQPLTFLVLLVISWTLYGQPAPCSNGAQPTCKCHTAPILNTIEELNGYQYAMTVYQHPADGPNPLCNQLLGGVPNNPTWFGFKACCSSLNLTASVSDCIVVGGWIGIQIAVYSSCSPSFIPIACNTNTDSCNTNDKKLKLNNLTVGENYYFMVDGCNGSYCKVTIKVDFDTTTSILEITNPKLSVSPNPIHSEFSISGIPNSEIQSVVVYNSLGNLVKRFKPHSTTYSFHDMPSGIYFLDVTTISGEKFMLKILHE